MLGSLELALAPIELLLEVLNDLIFVGQGLQFSLSDSLVLVDLCSCPAPLGADLEQVDRVAFLRGDGRRIADDLQYLRVDANVHVLPLCKLIMSPIDPLSDELGKRPAYDEVTDI